MLFKFKRMRAMDPLQVAMTGVRMGEKYLQVFCSDMFKKAVPLMFAFTLLASTAFAQERKDLQVFRDISDSVNRYSQFTIFDNIEASVADGRVVLSGWVTMPYKGADLERRVVKVAGVTAVDNKIEVLPVSQFDDELRFRIARAIYSHSSFWNYAAMASPVSRPCATAPSMPLSNTVAAAP